MIPKEMLKKVRRIQIRTRHAVSDVFAGQYHSVFKGQGMEFQEVREYAPGDEIRSIDWNVTARMGHPFVKKYREERELTVMILVDISGSQQPGSSPQLKKDLAAELAAVIAFAAIQNNDRVGLVLFSDGIEHVIQPAKGARHVLRVIRDVLYVKPAGNGTNIGKALDHLNRIQHRRSVAFLISDFNDDRFARALTVTARRHDLIALSTRDAREVEWPDAGVVALEDAETGRRFLVDTSDRRTRERYAALQKQIRGLALSMLRGAGVDLIEVEAGKPYQRELTAFFRRRERRLGT